MHGIYYVTLIGRYLISAERVRADSTYMRALPRSSKVTQVFIFSAVFEAQRALRLFLFLCHQLRSQNELRWSFYSKISRTANTNSKSGIYSRVTRWRDTVTSHEAHKTKLRSRMLDRRRRVKHSHPIIPF